MSTIPTVEKSKMLKDTHDDHYIGRVLSNADPLELGRVKVEVLPLFKGLGVDIIPWGICLYSGNFLSVPEEGTFVVVKFLSGDIDTPLVIGKCQSFSIDGEDYVNKFDFTKQEVKLAACKDSENASLLTNEPLLTRNPSYPNNHSLVTSNGIIIEVDNTESKERVHVRHPSGTFIVLTKDGDIHIHSANDTGIYSEGNIKVIAESGVEILGDHDNTSSGVVQGDCICPYTGKPHWNISSSTRADQ